MARMASMGKTEFASHRMTGFVLGGYAVDVVGAVLALDDSIADNGYQTLASIMPSLTFWRSSSRGFRSVVLILLLKFCTLYVDKERIENLGARL
ncbi:hypothetical protein Fmac_024791 [Flemingia macrophylla]|uniref:Uncharacterized protein n=1 Tax=Flemingia macrophylla TaxID=520843 RepID=A0ABD1LQH2_9FABA